MKIITQKELASLAEDAFKNADKHGFYPEKPEIETALMLIITEMAEVVQADRKNRHGNGRSCSGRPQKSSRKYRRL